MDQAAENYLSRASEFDWQPSPTLAAALDCHRTTVERAARGEFVSLDDRLHRVERRKPTAVERLQWAGGLRYVYRVRRNRLPHRSIDESLREERERPSAETDERDIEIDWRKFVVTHDGEEWVSLRAMVEHGQLYSNMYNAKRALEDTEMFFIKVRKNRKGRGRPRTDYYLRPLDAQLFAAGAGTETGRRIARVLIQHHNAYQRMRFDEDVVELNRLRSKLNEGPTESVRQSDALVQTARLNLEIAEELARLESRIDSCVTRDEVLGMIRAEVAQPRRKKVSVGRRLETVRKNFDRAVSAVAMNHSRRTGVPIDEFRHDLNAWLKGVIRKGRAKWTLGDYILAVELLDQHKGISLYHVFQVDSEQAQLLFDDPEAA